MVVEVVVGPALVLSVADVELVEVVDGLVVEVPATVEGTVVLAVEPVQAASTTAAARKMKRRIGLHDMSGGPSRKYWPPLSLARFGRRTTRFAQS
jgi:hypothetical protein